MNYLLYTLSLQGTAALLTLIGALIVVSVVLFVIKSTSTPIEGDYHVAKEQVYKLQKPYFIGLLLLIATLFIYSFQFLPYYADRNHKDIEVTVAGVMFSWRMAEGELEGDISDFKGKGKISLPVDNTINFSVGSIDVTHNFAIYNEEGNVIAQTQAMPGYMNKLEYTFTKKGSYKIACFEYCGLAHSAMVGELMIKSEEEYIEDKEYEKIRRVNELEIWKNFLNQFPNGQYMETALKKIEKLEKELHQEKEEALEDINENTEL